MRFPSVLLVAFFLVIGVHVRAEKLDDILNEISFDLGEKETAGPTEKPPVHQAIRNSEESPEPSPKRQDPVAEKPSEPDIPGIVIHRAQDKLPKDFRGQGLVGKFLITATNKRGNPLIVSAEDSNNPFARLFWIINADAGFGASRSFIGEDRPEIHFAESKPLIFVGIAIPGVYNVKLP